MESTLALQRKQQQQKNTFKTMIICFLDKLDKDHLPNFTNTKLKNITIPLHTSLCPCWLCDGEGSGLLASLIA